MSDMDGKHGVLLGYVIVGGAGLLTLLHMGFLSLLVATGSLFYHGARIKGTAHDVWLSHYRWQRRSALLLLAGVGGLFAWFAVELTHIGEGNLFAVLASHWIAHTLVSVIMGVWILVRVIRGVLRYTDRQPI
ncbi:MAG: hypothetical protein CVV05_01010 [Gammaproteobacteria bacterium HGW-Gammaproteobacteria-1]|jgi:uncharacterized membrane protein|nr:MAG: hypothetical protein CVV05_01010 [Gammaproteobacteria bacterium HGW-Gammaproteobacteria-1]